MPVQEQAQQVVRAVAGVYRGRREAVELVVTAFLAGGHVLVEDIPGVGKTTLARAMAAAVGGTFRRIQGNPDLLPADITGVSIYDEAQRQFRFHPGPLFSDVLLADELNRTPPRTQSALLEALGENQVTVEGQARVLSSLFLCLATQNPIDQAGTYPLPDSQRDRFLVSLALGYPAAEAEHELLVRDGAAADLARLQPVLDAPAATRLRAAVRAVRVETNVRDYLLALVQATRTARDIRLGASPRAALGWQRAAQARAVLAGRDFVAPEDVQALAEPVLSHRLVMRAGVAATDVIARLTDEVAVPW